MTTFESHEWFKSENILICLPENRCLNNVFTKTKKVCKNLGLLQNIETKTTCFLSMLIY